MIHSESQKENDRNHFQWSWDSLVCRFFHLIGDYKRRISRFAKSNETALEEIALDQLCGVKTADEYQGVKVEGAIFGKHNIVQFLFGVLVLL